MYSIHAKCLSLAIKRQISNFLETYGVISLKLAISQRPKAHFTPQKNWINDPNGLIYLNKTYHLFYQYNPNGSQWGHMSWGHATSEDLKNWTEHTVAISDDPIKGDMIFSGCTILDKNNITGLATTNNPVLIAIYTNQSRNNGQEQSLAFSNDSGYTWTKYEENPLIPNPGCRDFRDPKVIWYEPRSIWVMVLASAQIVKFFVSKDLLNWEFVSDFGENEGCHAGEWECPDLFQIVADNSIKKWVLVVSINPGGPNGGSGTQYFVGRFDGLEFKAEHEDVRWLDFGPDNYANMSWEGLQDHDNRRISIGWMSNWSYAKDIPTFPWRGAMTIPRELNLKEDSNQYWLCTRIAHEVTNDAVEFFHSDSNKNLEIALPSDTALIIEIALQEAPIAPVHWKITNAVHEEIVIKYQPNLGKISLDRRFSGWDFKLFTTPIIEAFVQSSESEVQFKILLDSSSIEIFWGNGSTNITALTFPNHPFNVFKIDPTKQDIKILCL